MKLVVVIPAFNEELRIAKTIEAVKLYTDAVVVVDDGSSDRTSVVAKEAGATVIRHMINCGPGAATQTGLVYAKTLRPDYVATFDADGQHEASDLPAMVEFLIAQKKEVVFGSRFLQSNRVPLLRRLANTAGNLITFVLSGIYLSDSQSGFKIFTLKALEHITITANGFEFCSEIVREVASEKLTFCEFPIKVYYSEETLAKGQNLSTGITTMFKLIVRSLMK
jgi:glycosyltransferase involved in cell wall biosynthesis